MTGMRSFGWNVAERLRSLGFPADFAAAVGSCADTPYLSRRMLGYLNSASPRKEEDVADELLIIREDRDRFREKMINRRRKKPMNDRFLRGFSIDWTARGLRESYVAGIPSLQSLREMAFTCGITFFCGENGSGKSTLLEALAIACGLNPEGGTQNYRFSTYDDYSRLSEAIRLSRGISRPERSYFLRAESFFNMATAALREYNPDGRMPDYHARSHGESFLDFILDNRGAGLYLMDEPEAALSPQRQLELLVYLVQASRAGSQFIIATHSPLLLGTPGAEIWSFDDTVHPVSYRDTGSFQIMDLFLNNRERFLRELLREND